MSSKVPLRLWAGHATLIGALVAACVGQIGDGGGSGPGGAGGGGGGGGGGSSGAGSSGGSSADAAAGAPDGGPPLIPFEPFSVPAYVTKVKTMLTGLAPTQAEIDQVNANASALSGLVTTWMTAPGVHGEDGGLLRRRVPAVEGAGHRVRDPARRRIDQPLRRAAPELPRGLREDGDGAHRRGQAVHRDGDDDALHDDDGDDAVLRVRRQQHGRPTRRRPAPARKRCRFYDDDPSWSWQLTVAGRCPSADSGNPSSPNYLKFSLPNLTSQYGQNGTGSLGAQDTSPSGSACSATSTRWSSTPARRSR